MDNNNNISFSKFSQRKYFHIKNEIKQNTTYCFVNSKIMKLILG